MPSSSKFNLSDQKDNLLSEITKFKTQIALLHHQSEVEENLFQISK